MPNSDLLPSLLFKINQNSIALETAIMELTLWVDQLGSSDVADNVRRAISMMSLAVLMTGVGSLRTRQGTQEGHARPNKVLRIQSNRSEVSGRSRGSMAPVQKWR